MQYTQSYAAVRITSGQPDSAYTRVVKDLRNGACYITTWLHLFNGKFLIPHTIVVSQLPLCWRLWNSRAHVSFLQRSTQHTGATLHDLGSAVEEQQDIDH